ncbi:MAG: right-handed parallel beta-helix repeat-containing protein [Verrucomicrobia bacterium]|nr:right-handed parallel beta-helix repeat-containing protein [Verrucomicrobiota bacterium]
MANTLIDGCQRRERRVLHGRTHRPVVALVCLSLASAGGLTPTAEAGNRRLRATPRDNITEIAAGLQPGDQLLLRKGLYTQTITLSGLKGTAKRPIIVRGEPGVIIEPDDRDGILFFGGGGSEHVVVEGITIRGATRAGILVNSSRDITIRACDIGSNGVWGIQTVLSDRITVEDCQLYGSGEQHGVYFSTTDHPVVRRCHIFDNAACGIHFNGDKREGGDGLISGGVVEDNVIHGNGRLGGAAVNMDSAEQMTVRNNLIFDNRAGGITAFSQDGLRAGDGNRILNNTVVFQRGQGRFAVQLIGAINQAELYNNVLVCGRGPALECDSSSAAGISADRNLYFTINQRPPILVGNDALTLGDWQARTAQDVASQVAGPRFQQADAGDYRLAPDSPARRLSAGVADSVARHSH